MIRWPSTQLWSQQGSSQGKYCLPEERTRGVHHHNVPTDYYGQISVCDSMCGLNIHQHNTVPNHHILIHQVWHWRTYWGCQDRHVRDISQCYQHRVILERLFLKLPFRFLIKLVAVCIFWLNVFPVKVGISTTSSSRTIITGLEINCSNKHCKLYPR